MEELGRCDHTIDETSLTQSGHDFKYDGMEVEDQGRWLVGS